MMIKLKLLLTLEKTGRIKVDLKKLGQDLKSGAINIQFYNLVDVLVKSKTPGKNPFNKGVDNVDGAILYIDYRDGVYLIPMDMRKPFQLPQEYTITKEF